MLAVEGIPIFYLELVIGQRLRKGAVGAWNDISPYFGGIGEYLQGDLLNLRYVYVLQR